jgi:hypothetical protein
MSVFNELMKVNVNDKTDKKGKFTYLSWAFAWAELKKIDETATVHVYHDETNNKPYFGLGEAGVLVKVGVTVGGTEHISYLPCMDFKNKAIAESDVDAMDINKAIQRATVKAIGLHGWGLDIYAGEDLPEGAEVEETPKKEAPKKTAAKSKPQEDAKVESSEEAPKRSAAAKARNNFRERNKTSRTKSRGL